MLELPKRQVHLDFHTSPDIPGIGSKFSPENFKKALKTGNVESITVFAKCHHGYCYYPTKVGEMHPHLDFDLTGAMVDAAHEAGVRAPVYITAGWSHKDAMEHPEWRAKNKQGEDWLINYDESRGMGDAKPFCSWHLLCLNDGSYCRHIYSLTEEVCRHFKQLDGLFYDICVIGDVCYCDECRAGMVKMGLDPENEEDAKRYFIIKRSDFMRKCGEILHKYHKDATIFFNSGGADAGRPQYHEYQTHFEMEDLPTAWGGYDKMPLRAKFFEKSGKPFLGMTGKFHLDWGEFGGFKTKEALKYETAAMALYGAGCSIGDQLHPDGEMELSTYENIGYAYDYLERIEPFCYGGESTADLGLYLSDNRDSNEGVCSILLENQIDFDIVKDGDFDRFKTVIFPDCAALREEDTAAFDRFLKGGGSVLFSGESLLKDGKFLIDCGVDYLGPAQYDCDYIRPLDELQFEDVRSPFLCYIPSVRAKARLGTKVLSEVLEPYFSRTYGRFCGHKNTPYNKSAERTLGMAQHGNVIYISHKIGEIYKKYGAVLHKRYFMSALSRIYTPRLRTDLYSEGRCRLISQPDKNRYCLNMLYCSPSRRGCAEIVEDIVPLYSIPVEIDLSERVKSVKSGLTGEKLDFKQNEKTLYFTLPKLSCHEAVVIEY